MGGQARTSNSIRRAIRTAALGLAITSGALGLAATPAHATPQDDLASETLQATKLEQQIATNSERADVLDEQYNEAQNAVGAALTRIAATQKQIAATQKTADLLRDQLGGRAALLYEGAGNVDPLGFDVASVQDLGSMSQYGEAAAAQDMRVLQTLQATNEQLATQHDTLEGQLAAAQDQATAAASARRKVASANASMQHLLDTTKANIKTLAATLAAQAAAAAAGREQAALAAQQAAARAAARRAHDANGNTSTTNPGNGGNGPGVGTEEPVGPIPPPSKGAAAAVAYAYAQLGKPYVYAGIGPASYDCSGLTMMAWLQAGVQMLHGSQAQYDDFPKVPLDQLQPGDLVFFGDTGPTNHHVGIVVGPGMMIDAPHTGAYVELVSYYWSDLLPLGVRP